MNNEGSYICECDTGYIEGMGGSTDEYCTEGDCPGSCLDFDECDARTHKVKLNKSIFQNLSKSYTIASHSATLCSNFIFSVKNCPIVRILTVVIFAIAKLDINWKTKSVLI